MKTGQTPQNPKRLQIGVIGYAGIEEYPKAKAPKPDLYVAAEQVGFLLGQNGVIVITGGKSGVMEAAACGAKRANGTTVGVIKGVQRFDSNKFIDVEVLTGMEANGFDEFLLVNMADALIVLGGGAGTLEEIAIAYRNQKPIIALSQTGGWADQVSLGFLDERETVKVKIANTPAVAVKQAIKLAKQRYE